MSQEHVDVLGEINEGWQAASIVYFFNTATQKVLLGEHNRGPFAGRIDGFWGKYDPQEWDGDMLDCSIRETATELCIAQDIIEKTHLKLKGVLICLNTGKDKKNRRVPVYAYIVDWENDIPFQANGEEMKNICWYACNDLPVDLLKWWAQELIIHIASGVQELLFLETCIKKGNKNIRFADLKVLNWEVYEEYYRTIMK